MDELSTRHLLDALFEHQDYFASIFLAYGADLAFFEEAILHRLWQNGCRDNLVFVDAERYADTIRDMSGTVTWVGRRYLLTPIRVGSSQSFHPKLIMLLGPERGRLLVGSGNLSFTGMGHNHEVFTCLDWARDEPELQPVFHDAWDLVSSVQKQWGHSKEAGDMLREVGHVADWLFPRIEQPAGVQLIHTVSESLIEQCNNILGLETIQKITVVTPFLDDHARAVGELHQRFHPKEFRLVLQDKQVVGNVNALKQLRKASVPLKVYLFNDDQRYLHAKIYLFETNELAYALTGSANCTRAAWLSASDGGNVEVMLLRRGDSRKHFAPLLKGFAAPQALTSLDQITMRRRPVLHQRHREACVQLWNIAVSGGKLCVDFAASDLPRDVVDLQLCVLTAPRHFVSLGCREGSDSVQLPMSREIQGLLMRPIASSIWGMSSAGNLVDLGCNYLWITNSDVLRYEITRLPSVGIQTGSLLAGMALESEDEWNDLYQSLATLIELDVTGLRRQGTTYATVSSNPQPELQPDTDSEDNIHLVEDETDLEMKQKECTTALFQKSPFSAWFEYVRSGLPGQPPPPNYGGQGTPGPGSRTKRRRPPSKLMARRFCNLVTRYIESLNNVEYMQTAPVPHLLAYYVTFQRVIWLLHEHRAISHAEWSALLTKINMGFFGSPEQGTPALCPRLRHHMLHVWHEDWRRYRVQTYALIGIVLMNRRVNHSKQARLKSQSYQQSLHILGELLAVVGVDGLLADSKMIEEVARIYEEDPVILGTHASRWVTENLTSSVDLLEEWSRTVTITLGKTGDPTPERLLLRARVDYGLARFRILEQLRKVDAQIELCSDLIFWLQRAGENDIASQIAETLAALLEGQGKSHELAHALFREGNDLFFEGHYQESANKLRQSLVLARKLGDDELIMKCDQSLKWNKLFLK